MGQAAAERARGLVREIAGTVLAIGIIWGAWVAVNALGHMVPRISDGIACEWDPHYLWPFGERRDICWNVVIK